MSENFLGREKQQGPEVSLFEQYFDDPDKLFLAEVAEEMIRERVSGTGSSANTVTNGFSPLTGPERDGGDVGVNEMKPLVEKGQLLLNEDEMVCEMLPSKEGIVSEIYSNLMNSKLFEAVHR